jgi:HEAT repeat protein
MIERETVDDLRALVHSDDVNERREAVEILAVLEDLPALLSATASTDTYVRARAVRALASVGGWKITLRLLRAVRDAEAEVREATALALGARGGWLAVRALRKLSRDQQSRVRYRALVSLAHVGSAAAWNVLDMASTRDDEEWIRRSAACLRSGVGYDRCDVFGPGKSVPAAGEESDAR